MAFAPRLTAGEAVAHANALDAWRERGELTTPARLQHFLVQAHHATRGFTQMSEDVVRLVGPRRYSSARDARQAAGLARGGAQALANQAYAGRFGNGLAESGDGWNFRPRGYLRVLGRASYRRLGEMIEAPLEELPGLLADPDTAARAAVAVWTWRGLNGSADHARLHDINLALTPGDLDPEARQVLLAQAGSIWS